ncbi:MAG: NADH-quinone oxidoreductase subunit L, partial [Gammaproteobacteria bacterium]
MEDILLTIVLAPLLASVIAGLFGGRIGRAGAHRLTILAVGVSFVLSVWILEGLISGRLQPYDGTVYTWGVSDGLHMEVG